MSLLIISSTLIYFAITNSTISMYSLSATTAATMDF